MQNTSPYDPPAHGRYRPSAWGGSPYTELTVPSGGICLVRRLQPMDLLAENLLNVTNLLGETVSRKIAEAKAGPQDHLKKKAEQDAEDEERIAAALGNVFTDPTKIDLMIDTVALRAVVEPELQRPPAEYVERQEGIIYLDTVPFDDKMAIFNWVMSGIDALKSVRRDTEQSVAPLDAGEDLPHSSQ